MKIRLQQALTHYYQRSYFSRALGAYVNFKSPQLPPPPSQEVLVHGLHSVQAVLNTSSRRILRGYILISDGHDDEPLQRIESELRARNIQIVRSERNTLARMSRGATHQGVVLEVSAAETRELLPGTLPSFFTRTTIAENDKSSHPLVLLLDEVVDPHNLGAIMRSAFLLGANAIVLSKHSSAPLGATASKASSGAMEVWLASKRLFHTRNTTTLVQSFGDSGWKTIGAVAAPSTKGTLGRGISPVNSTIGAVAAPSTTGTIGRESSLVPASSLRRDMPTLLVLGNEGEGMRPITRKACHTLCFLEQEPAEGLQRWPNLVDSLNVSAAAALLLNALKSS